MVLNLVKEIALQEVPVDFGFLFFRFLVLNVRSESPVNLGTLELSIFESVLFFL